jgi:hypothetical protein
VKKSVTFSEVLVSMVPTNIFSALANGRHAEGAGLRRCCSAWPVGHVPSRISEGLTHSLETVYHSCQTLMRWLSYPLPLGAVLHERGAAGQDRHRSAAGHDPVRRGFFIASTIVPG